MKYINPYDIANSIDFDNLNITNLKKFKRRLSAELELNDGEIIINNIVYQQNDIYDMLDRIDRDKSLLNIYHSIYSNDKLNNFLYGQYNTTHLKLLKNILLLEDLQTIKFITPYIADRLSAIYKNAFLNGRIDILKIEPPIDKLYYEQIYEPIYKILKSKEVELINLKDKLYDIEDIESVIGNIDMINALPEYFTKIRHDIAYAVRNLSIDSWNNNQNLELSNDLINLALNFKLNDNIKENFINDKNDLEKMKEEQFLLKLANKIEKTLNNNSKNFSKKIDEIIKIINNNKYKVKRQNTLAIVIYNIINKHIENNNELIFSHFKDLKKIFQHLENISTDYELINALNENINSIELIEEKVQTEKENKYANNGMFIGGFIGLAGGFAGVIIGAVIGYILGKVAAQ